MVANQVNQVIAAKFDSGENQISSSIDLIQLPHLADVLRSSSYRLAPKPERKPWKIKTKSRLIESFFTNIPVKPLIGVEGDDRVVEIIDGRERLKAIVEFYNNQFALSGLELWSKLNGLTYREISPVYRFSILDRRWVSLILIEPKGETSNDQFQKLIDLAVRRLNSR